MNEELDETRRIERREFERIGREPGEGEVEPVPAATLVLARPREAGFEVLLLRRPEEATFAAGVWVFPGGTLDPGDRGEEVEARLGPEVTPRRRGALVAALRELFEETGLLPADELPPEEALRRGREELLAGEVGFPELVRRWDVTFRDARVAYFARWITPARLSRRFDTHFFLARHRGGEPRLLGEELTDHRWVAPGDAVRAFGRGELPLLFPTRKTLESLSEHGRLEEAMESFRAREVRPVRPRLLVGEDGVTPVLPGDPGYGEAG